MSLLGAFVTIDSTSTQDISHYLAMRARWLWNPKIFKSGDIRLQTKIRLSVLFGILVHGWFYVFSYCSVGFYCNVQHFATTVVTCMVLY